MKHQSDHKDSYIEKTVHQLDIDKISTVDDLALQWSESAVFSGGQLGKIIDIMYHARKNSAKFFVGLAGAMIPGGMRKAIVNAIQNEWIHVLTTTGANITHDLIETFGGGHIRNIDIHTDAELRKKGIDRVYNSYVKQGSFELFEEKIKSLLSDIFTELNKNNQLIITPSDLLYEIGSRIDDENSIVRQAFLKNVRIYVPAISDSVLGLQLWLFSQFNNIIIDTISDLEKIQTYFYENKTRCAVLFGGGVPKNYTLQAALMASTHYQYAVQITMDRVETGGLSGASLSEAISWGKLEDNAIKATAICDITIALPIILSALQQRLKKN
ncbi:MAG: deoxyhypusine synthase family protein [Candidatus Heimdallarchaeota archaeon]|nr:deoxyhypusine synthase family protein [Candidatus Heimdallarchaeota archaeon]